MLREIFTDKTGKISSKRVFGALLVIAAIVLVILERGAAESVNTMLWAGVASLGVGTLETKVSK